MYSYVTDEFISAVNQNSRTFRARLLFDDFVIGTDDANKSSSRISRVKFTGGGNENNQISVGVAVSQTVDIELVAEYEELNDKEFNLEIGLKLADGTYEYVPFGRYTPKKTKIKGGVTSFTAYDNMAKADKKYETKLLYPNTVENIVKDACQYLGFEYDTSFDFKDYTIATPPEPTTTFRDMFGYIAAFYGKSAIFDRYGRLTFKWFEPTDYELKDRRIKTPEKSEGHFIAEYLSVQLADEEYLNRGNNEGKQGITLENPFMTVGKMDYLWEQIQGFEYDAYKIDVILADPRIDPFDILIYKGLKIPCMKLEYSFDGGLWGKIQSVIATEREYESPAERKQKATLNKIKDSSTVIATTNGADVLIGVDEAKITSANISVGLKATPYLMFTAQIEANNDALIEFRITLNATIAMSYWQRVFAGKSIVSFAYPILDLQAGTYQTEVWCVADVDCGVIPMLTAKQIIAGQGLTRTEGWNGLLTFSTGIPLLELDSKDNLSMLPFSTMHENKFIVPNISNISAVLPALKLASNEALTISGLTGIIGIGEYPYFVSAVISEDNIILTFKGHIADDETVEQSFDAFNIVGFIGGVLTRLNVNDIIVFNFAENNENLTELTITVEGLTSAYDVTLKYDGNVGKLHTGSLSTGHKVNSFELELTR